MADFTQLAKREMSLTAEGVHGYPWEDAYAYGIWLAQTFHIVNHSTRLVALAGACVSFEHNDLHARFVDHSREERGHQLVCVSDLKKIGYSVEDFPCLPPSAALFQIQYYWIQHRSPISFFGYVLALECLATAFGAEIHRRVEKVHGPSAAKFLNLHAADDIEHTRKAFEQLARLAPPDQEQVRQNLELTASLYRDMLRQAKERVKAVPPMAAAA